MKKLLLGMSCLLLLLSAACAHPDGMEKTVETDIQADSRDDAVSGDVPPDINKAEAAPSTEAYREIYAQIINEAADGVDVAFISLNDDDIPELVLRVPEDEAYFVYTVRDGERFCLVDSMRVWKLVYYARTGIIAHFENFGERSYYQVLPDRTMTNDTKPTLTYNGYVYDENDQGTGEFRGTCTYQGEEGDEAVYETVCEEWGINDMEEKELCMEDGIEKEDAILLLSSPDVMADHESSANLSESYRDVYRQKLEEITDDIRISFLYLDDDDIPEMAVRRGELYFIEPSSYSIYTFRNGELLCLVDLILKGELVYYERQGIIDVHMGERNENTEMMDRYYQIVEGETVTNDSPPILEYDWDILYDEDGLRRFDEEPNHYRYMGEEIDEITYEEMRKKLGITEDPKIICSGNGLEKEIALELLNP